MNSSNVATHHRPRVVSQHLPPPVERDWQKRFYPEPLGRRPDERWAREAFARERILQRQSQPDPQAEQDDEALPIGYADRHHPTVTSHYDSAFFAHKYDPFTRYSYPSQWHISWFKRQPPVNGEDSFQLFERRYFAQRDARRARQQEKARAGSPRSPNALSPRSLLPRPASPSSPKGASDDGSAEVEKEEKVPKSPALIVSPPDEKSLTLDLGKVKKKGLMQRLIPKSVRALITPRSSRSPKAVSPKAVSPRPASASPRPSKDAKQKGSSSKEKPAKKQKPPAKSKDAEKDQPPKPAKKPSTKEKARFAEADKSTRKGKTEKSTPKEKATPKAKPAKQSKAKPSSKKPSGK